MYIPDRGDLVWITFDPAIGHEQAGRRPAVVISRQLYNARARLAVICPVTSRAKGYSFEVALPAGLGVHGVILSDHLKSVDWRQREIEYIGTLPLSVVQTLTDRVEELLLK